VTTRAERRPLLALAALLLPFALAAEAGAAPILLEDGVALLEIDPASPDGLTGWTVNGVPHLRTQQLFVRAGADTAETSIAALDLVSAAASDGDGDGREETLAIAYADPAGRFDLSLRYELSGTAIGDPTVASDLRLDVALTSRGDALFTARLFQYTDVDLFTSFADDELVFSGAPDRARVTDSSGLGAYESSWSGAPDAVEAALFDATLASLTDGAPTALSGALAASGDVTHAVSWQVVGGGAWTQAQSIRVVPEPGAALLVALGLAMLARRREEPMR
jgi:hypothetical protein